MFVTNWISTTKIQKISEITNFFRHYFLSRTEVLLLYRPPGITFDVWGQNKKPRSYYASGAVSSFFLSILRIVYFYMGEEG